MYTLRPDQLAATEDAVTFLKSSSRTDKNPSRLYKGPTGSGKSYIEAELLRRLGPTHHQLVPTIEIAAGIARKLGFTICGTEAEQRRLTEQANIFTTMRYKNLLMNGRISLPSTMCFDEAHHVVASTNRDVWTLCGCPPRVGLTATDYRGTPAGTYDLLEDWNHDVYTIITIEKAILQGIISLPHFSIWPLLNDDLIKVVNGEFHVASVTSAARDKTHDLAERVSKFYDGTRWDRPTMITFSSVHMVNYAEAVFSSLGLPVVSVVGDTKARDSLFAKVVDCSHLLLQVRVVGEGVDLPLRRLIDLAPMMSPMEWMQLVGRITRPTSPGEEPPEYIGCCHNLLRHAYLFAGVIPGVEIRKAQQAWGKDFKPTRRSMARALGIEGFGKFKPTPVPLADGLTGTFYGLQQNDGRDEWGVWLHPVHPVPLYFHRTNTVDDSKVELKVLPNGREVMARRKTYGKWKLIQKLPDLDGCVSLTPHPWTPGQKYKWEINALRFGFDPKAEVNAKQLAALMCFMGAGIKVKEVAKDV